MKTEIFNIKFTGNPKILKRNYIYGIDFWWNYKDRNYYINKKTQRELL